MSWILYALGAQIGWVISIFIDKFLLEHYTERHKAGVLVLYSALFSLVVVPVLFFFLKGVVGLELTHVMRLMLAGVFSVSWLFLYLSALSEHDASRAIPLFQMIPAFGLVLGSFFLGEHISTTAMWAIFVVVVGAMILSYETPETPREGGKKFFFAWSLAGRMLGAGFLVALSELFFKWGALGVPFFVAQFWVHVGILLVGVWFLVKKRSWREVFFSSLRARGVKIFGINMANEGVNAVASMLFGFATLGGLLAVVQASNAFQPVLILLVGLVLTRFFPRVVQEDTSRTALTRKVVGIVCVVVGALFLY